MGKINPGLYSSNRQDWQTPPDFLETLLKFCGQERFDLDPCCTHKNVPAEHHYTAQEDGLASDWQVTTCPLVFMNPEYGSLKEWIAKAVSEAERGARVWGLFPARLDTSYWHDLVFQPHGFVFFLRKRLSFWLDNKPYQPVCSETGKAKDSSAPFPAALVYWTYSKADAKRVMKQFSKNPPFEGTLVTLRRKVSAKEEAMAKMKTVRTPDPIGYFMATVDYQMPSILTDDKNSLQEGFRMCQRGWPDKEFKIFEVYKNPDDKAFRKLISPNIDQEQLYKIFDEMQRRNHKVTLLKKYL